MSAEHALGMDALLDAVVARLPAAARDARGGDSGGRTAPVRLAILGRPNVGKSTLLNALLQEKRVVASAEPGHHPRPHRLRPLVHEGRRFVLTDTAGIRRASGGGSGWRSTRVIAALRSMERSDVAVLLLDATEPAVDQDARLAGLVAGAGAGRSWWWSTSGTWWRRTSARRSGRARS